MWKLLKSCTHIVFFRNLDPLTETVSFFTKVGNQKSNFTKSLWPVWLAVGIYQKDCILQKNMLKAVVLNNW